MTDPTAALDLSPHPEGGRFRQTFKSDQRCTTTDGRTRSAATVIYFHLPSGESSAWHRVASDELWLAHTGTVVVELGGDGEQPVAGQRLVVGTDLDAGERPQGLVPAGVWQRTLPADHDALVSCVVAPGFEFDDFELAAD